MKNELAIYNPNPLATIPADICFIAKYSTLSVYEIIKRNIPEIKLYAEILGEKAFLAFDFVATIIWELTPIIFMAIMLLVKSVIGCEFVREIRRAIWECTVIPTKSALKSTAIFAKNIKTDAKEAWRFRQELINEWA